MSPRTSKLLWLALALATLTALQAPQVAEAQRGNVDISRPFTGQRPFQLDIHAGFEWWGVGFATGARFGIPIMNNGFVPSINNAVYINFGFDFYWARWRYVGAGNYWDYGAGFGIPVALHWEFYFNEHWSAFAEIGVNVYFHPRFLHGERYDVYDGGYWFLFAVGGSFHVNDWLLLTLRVGSPYIAFGVTFQFG